MKPVFYNSLSSFSFLEKSITKEYSLYVFLVDENTHTHCLPLVLKALSSLENYKVITIPSGEEHKNLSTCEKVWQQLTEYKADRSTLLINLGGGVVTDLGGFVASTYLRGIDFLNIPTSLLAMVDASVGGKTGIDFNHLKNRIGTFSFAEQTIIYPEFLQTLPKEELVSGFAEMLKHGLIADAAHFNNLSNIEVLNVENIMPFIEDSVMIKHRIFSEDPKEKGLRKILNFGHTIGHAIESFQLEKQQPILHGNAVAIGMYYETLLSIQEQLLSEEEAKPILETLQKFYTIFTFTEEEIQLLVEWMKNDKKNTHDKISFSLIDGIGNCKYDCFVEEKDVQSIFN